MSGRLDGKVAVVTGAASGIGRAAAQVFAREGAAVVCTDRSDQAAQTARSIVGADVKSLADMERVAVTAFGEFGSLDVLYANAGIAGVGTAGDTISETWHEVIAVNLTGVWHSMRTVLSFMRRQGHGSTVLQSSAAGVVGVPGIFPYAVAKGGVIAMARQAAIVYGPEGIRVNAVVPGTVVTELVTQTYDTRAATQERALSGGDLLARPRPATR